MLSILDVVSQGIRLRVVPYVSYHTVHGGLRPGRERRMPDHRLGVGVAIVGIGEYRTFIQEKPKTTVTQPIFTACEQIRSKPVDGHLQHQPDIPACVPRE